MNKPSTFLFSFTYLFLFSGFVYGEELEVKKTYWDNRKLKIETHYKYEKEEVLATRLYESGEKKHGDTLWIRMKT
jgi:antitoxin component YwqK of YwqJK toxin-antitoxin module